MLLLLFGCLSAFGWLSRYAEVSQCAFSAAQKQGFQQKKAARGERPMSGETHLFLLCVQGHQRVKS
jgi:hypothetical protein